MSRTIAVPLLTLLCGVLGFAQEQELPEDLRQIGISEQEFRQIQALNEETQMRIRTALASVVAEGQRCGEIDSSLDPELSAAMLIAVIDGLLLQHFVDSRAFADLDALSDELVRSIRKSLAP